MVHTSRERDPADRDFVERLHPSPHAHTSLQTALADWLWQLERGILIEHAAYLWIASLSVKKNRQKHSNSALCWPAFSNEILPTSWCWWLNCSNNLHNQHQANHCLVLACSRELLSGIMRVLSKHLSVLINTSQWKERKQANTSVVWTRGSWWHQTPGAFGAYDPLSPQAEQIYACVQSKHLSEWLNFS